MPFTFEGRAVLVSGSNRGIGKAYVDALLAVGAARIYAGAREPAAVETMDRRVVPVALDVTDPGSIAAAAARCGDVTALVNNAGVNFNTKLLGTDNPEAARLEIETNYLGTLAMCRSFVPLIEANGGGAVVNMCSVLARASLPVMGSLCASKAATYSMTLGLRAELASRGIAVFAVMPGAVDTDQSRDFPPPKSAPADIVAEVLAAMARGTPDIYPGDMARGLVEGLRANREAVLQEMAGYV